MPTRSWILVGVQDPHAVVREGYDAIGEHFVADRPTDGADVALLPELTTLLAPGDRVLDAGSGAGVPVATRLVEAGLAVTALDVSANQLRLARRLVPNAGVTQADLVELPFQDHSFRAVISFYAVIHVPRDRHGRAFDEFRRVLEPGGFALLCLGASDIPENFDPESWLGVPMFWSHFDADTNVAMLQRASFRVLWQRLISDPMNQAQHLFALATRP